MSETECLPRPPASEGSRSPEPNLIANGSDLGPAFSLHNSPIEQARVIGSDHARDSAHLGSPGPDSSCQFLGNDRRRAVRTSPPRSLDLEPLATRTSLDVDGDELLDLFSILGLDEDEKWAMDGGADDSGVAFPNIQPPRLSSSSGGRVRRKRGDTIRASDFPFAPTSVSFDGHVSSSVMGGQRVPPRRTRSGTITQASNTISADSNSSSSGRRKHEGWPTIKMRTTTEPLRVHGDDADDELLLKDGDIVD
ncbi:hypothetical protein PYCCODRAFT_1407088 [Trametes coccinea BRFM310]|uniref:Uncharacterized protein n=1 Tax=Trametes coccinea (strain BRFM310) TaxID=1353009 RepID=A0A1Y2IUS9_TRAC3|nr:hypothetical protein PYCCODRAFT_1407088 [Trametes coccinea BRFM310]